MEKYDVIMFLGQSNMQGQSGCVSETEVVENAFEYKFLTDKIVPLANPVGEDIKYNLSAGYPYTDENQDEWRKDIVLGSPLDGCTTLLPEFCRNYVGVTGRCVVAIHAAKGATTVAQWLPGTEGYKAVKAKASACFKLLGERVGKVYAVWLQGESDAIEATTSDVYSERLTLIKNQLKEDFGLEKFCIIKVGKFVFDERDEKIFDAQEKLCTTDDDFIMLTRITEKLFGGDKYIYVWGHYNALGQEIIGRIAGHNLGAYVEGLPFAPDSL
ncbi:MAG: hypothetical protein IJU84_03665 [Clostridia bacterium]|nr:hypothetical protein [Clostridia bacterium]